MSGKEAVEPDKKQEGAVNPMACCQGMTAAQFRECCGGGMREMMSRFAACRGEGQKEPPQCGEHGGDNHEDK